MLAATPLPSRLRRGTELYPRIRERCHHKKIRNHVFAQPSEELITKIRGCTVLYGDLVPLYGSAGLYLDCLKLTKQLHTSTHRDQLLNLPARGIRKLWKLSAGYYDVSEQDLLVASGQWFIEEDFRGQDCTIQAYGRSSVSPWGPPLVKSSTAYFSQHENGEIVGRVDSKLGMPGRLLYPRYFSCETGPGQLLPVTKEQASVTLLGCTDSHARPSQLQDLPMWPAPGNAIWPHSAPWAEFLRPVAPGVYSSSTWVYPNDVSKAQCVSHAILVKSDVLSHS